MIPLLRRNYSCPTLNQYSKYYLANYTGRIYSEYHPIYAGVLAGFPGTAVMLLVIYIGLKHSVHLAIAILLGIVAWGIFLIVQKLIMEGFVS